MSFEQLNSTSEKILKYFVEYERLDLNSLSLIMDQDAWLLADYMSILLSKRYIKNPQSADDIVFYMDKTYIITTAGKNYFDMKTIERNNFIKRSILIPIALAIIISIITTEITLILKGLQQ